MSVQTDHFLSFVIVLSTSFQVDSSVQGVFHNIFESLVFWGDCFSVCLSLDFRYSLCLFLNPLIRYQHCMKSGFQPCFLKLVLLQSVACMWALNDAVLFLVLFSIKHNSSSLHPTTQDVLFLIAATSLYPSHLLWKFLHSQGSALCPLGSTVRAHFYASFYLHCIAGLWRKIKLFFPEAVLPMKLLEPFVSVSDRSPFFEK